MIRNKESGLMICTRWLWSSECRGFCLYGKAQRICMWERSTCRMGQLFIPNNKERSRVWLLFGVTHSLWEIWNPLRIIYLTANSIETLMKSRLGWDAEKSTASQQVSKSCQTLDTHLYYKSPSIGDCSAKNMEHSQLTGMISAKSSTVGVWTDPTSAVSISGTTGGERSLR
jgi:hypothetical protein